METEAIHKVLAVLPTLQDIVSKIHRAECERLNKDVTHTAIIVDVQDTSIACVRIDPGSVPLIRLSGVWTLEQFFGETTENLTDAIRRGIFIAHKRLRWVLGKSQPRIAAEYVEKARSFRLTQGASFSLPPHKFRTVVTVTMTDPRTGEQEVRENVLVSDVERVQRELAHALTAKAYAHEQIAQLLDIMDGQELARNDPAPLESVSVEVVSPAHVIQTLHYVQTIPLENIPS